MGEDVLTSSMSLKSRSHAVDPRVRTMGAGRREATPLAKPLYITAIGWYKSLGELTVDNLEHFPIGRMSYPALLFQVSSTETI